LTRSHHRRSHRTLLVLVSCAFLATACSRPGQGELHFELGHGDLDTLRQVLVDRFREAQNHGPLRLASARARSAEGTMRLELVVTTDGPCTELNLAPLRDAARELATGAAVIALHAVAPDASKSFADHLRERFGRDVVTPFGQPGLVIFAMSEDEHEAVDAFAVLHPDLRVLTDPNRPDHHWVVASPTIGSADVAETHLAVRDRVTVDLVMRDSAVARLRALTESTRMAPLPITVDGVLALTPTLASRVTEGRLRLELPLEALALARRLAAATLTTAPQLVAERATCRPTE